MSAKHTPGSWRVGTKVGRTIYKSPEGGADALIGVMDRVEDARLAASAPELLEALRIVHRWLCDYPPSDRRGRWMKDTVDKALKATGDEP